MTDVTVVLLLVLVAGVVAFAWAASEAKKLARASKASTPEVRGEARRPGGLAATALRSAGAPARLL